MGGAVSDRRGAGGQVRTSPVDTCRRGHVRTSTHAAVGMGHGGDRMRASASGKEVIA